jgi:Holliday junction resolvasome RuvABC ATP-dependent DNA helicase subunit
LSINDLAKIVEKRLTGINIENGELLLEVANVSRGNGRESYKLASNIYGHLEKNKKNTFKYEDWNEIKKSLGIRKGGINNIEYRIMKYLQGKHNGASLSKLSSALQLTSEACRLGFERHLLGNDYIEVVNAKGRVLSKRGRDYLAEVLE